MPYNNKKHHTTKTPHNKDATTKRNGTQQRRHKPKTDVIPQRKTSYNNKKRHTK